LKLVQRIAVTVCIALACCTAARGQAPAPTQVSPAVRGEQQFAGFGDFKLQNGGVIHDFRIGYRTVGKLNAEKSNAVLWPTWLDGKSADLVQSVAPRGVDEEKYFVILVDAIGNGVTTSPSNSKSQPRMQFPEFTIRDMVESQRRLVTEVLHLTRLRAVMGVSMGGMQAFEWAVAYPDFMDLAITLVGSPQSTSYDKLFWTLEMDAIETDPAWNNGNPTGPLTRAYLLMAEIGSMQLTSPAYRVAHTKPQEFDSFLAELKKSPPGDAGTASNQIRQRQAINALDIGAEFHVSLEEAAKRVRAKMLVFLSPQDHTVNPEPALKFADALGAPVVILDSSCGHISLACVSAGPTVAQFLNDPASVHSMTLHELSAH